MELEFNRTVNVETVNAAFEIWYDIMLKQHEATSHSGLQSSRDGVVAAEFINATTIISDPTKNIVTSEIRKMPMRYAVGELLWYLSGSNKVDAIRPFSKAWDKLSDDGDTVNSAYGHRIHHKFGFDQWEHVKKLLRKDPNSRQAVIHIKDASEDSTKDLPCTVALQYFIREGKLYATTYMRSNDIWLGFPYDLFAFTCLQIKLAMELGVGIGTYTHFAGSLHMYARNLPLPEASQPKTPVEKTGLDREQVSKGFTEKEIESLLNERSTKALQHQMQIEKEIMQQELGIESPSEKFLSGLGYNQISINEG